jgi:hypothetical protein
LVWYQTAELEERNQLILSALAFVGYKHLVLLRYCALVYGAGSLMLSDCGHGSSHGSNVTANSFFDIAALLARSPALEEGNGALFEPRQVEES